MRKIEGNGLGFTKKVTCIGQIILISEGAFPPPSTQGHSCATNICSMSSICTQTLSMTSILFSESIIYRVSPTVSSVALLATPNWPGGMRPYSTVSWIVSLPSQYQAALQFVNVSQPKCDQRHTYIKVKTMGSEEEMFSRREDEEAEDELMVPDSFYLNMSNCLPQEGHFGAVTKVVLQRKTSKRTPLWAFDEDENILIVYCGICYLLYLS